MQRRGLYCAREVADGSDVAPYLVERDRAGRRLPYGQESHVLGRDASEPDRRAKEY